MSKKFKDLIPTTDISELLGAAENPDGETPGNKFLYSKDETLASNSNAVVPTQKAVKAYADKAQSNAEEYADGKFLPKGNYTLGHMPVAKLDNTLEVIDAILAGTNVTIETDTNTGAKTINATGGAVLQSNIAIIDPVNGDDTSGVVGDLSKPFASAMAADAAIVAIGNISETNRYTMYFTNGDHSFTSFSIRPFINYIGESPYGARISNVPIVIGVSSTFSSINNAEVLIQNLTFDRNFALNLSAAGGTTQTAKIYFSQSVFNGLFTFNGRNYSGVCNDQLITYNINVNNQFVFDSGILTQFNSVFNSNSSTKKYLIQSNIGNSTAYNYGSYINYCNCDGITEGKTSSVEFIGCKVLGITGNGLYANIKSDAASLSDATISLVNSAPNVNYDIANVSKLYIKDNSNDAFTQVLYITDTYGKTSSMQTYSSNVGNGMLKVTAGGTNSIIASFSDGSNDILKIGTSNNPSFFRDGLCIGNISFSNNSSAKLQIDSTTQGVLIPRLTTTQMNAITTPATGLQVYNTDNNSIYWYNGAVWNSDIITIFNNQTDNYTLVFADLNKVVEVNAATSKTITVPTDASVAFPIGSCIALIQQGAGQVVIAGDTGVTVRTASTLKLRAQYSGATLLKRAADEWYLAGDLEAI